MSNVQLPSGAFISGVPDGMPPQLAVQWLASQLKARQSQNRNQNQPQSPSAPGSPTPLQSFVGSPAGGVLKGLLANTVTAIPEMLASSPIPRGALAVPHMVAGDVKQVMPRNPVSDALDTVYRNGNALLDAAKSGIDAENAYYESARKADGHTGFDAPQAIGDALSFLMDPELRVGEAGRVAKTLGDALDAVKPSARQPGALSQDARTASDLSPPSAAELLKRLAHFAHGVVVGSQIGDWMKSAARPNSPDGGGGW